MLLPGTKNCAAPGRTTSIFAPRRPGEPWQVAQDSARGGLDVGRGAGFEDVFADGKGWARRGGGGSSGTDGFGQVVGRGGRQRRDGVVCEGVGAVGEARKTDVEIEDGRCDDGGGDQDAEQEGQEAAAAAAAVPAGSLPG